MKKRLLFGLGAIAGAAAASAAVLHARRDSVELADRIRRLQGTRAEHGKNIVILGAGFGGINTAAALLHRLPPESGWRVTLVDRHNYFLFTPLLYHAATGLVDPSNVLFPVRRLSHAENFIFREATVQDVDLNRRVVHLEDGPLSYDYLVLALGSVTNFFGKDDQLRHALTLKTSADAITVRNRLIDAFERADAATDPEERRRQLTFAVVGGGATGVELVGAIQGLIRGTLARQYPRISPGEARVVLFEALPKLLPELPRELAGYAEQRLRDLGVEIRLETPVDRVDDGGLVLDGGEYLPAHTVVWAAGVKASPVAARLNVPRIKNGRIDVDPFLQVEGVPDCYALGDIAAFTDEASGKPLPPTAAVAVRQGKALAEILLARIEGRSAQPFHYTPAGELVSLGRNEAVAAIKGVQITGFPAWLIWRAFYLSQLMGFKNRLAVALDWSFAYAYQRDTVRLEVPASDSEPSEHPLADHRAPAAATRDQ
ncbi:MAG: dehydrogenase (ubiquinone) [Armatimonadetes bacterium]|nr:dehydrogenase (ubiquinone) [Armatimonadota bacterium]